jgi:hypothetical protein
LQAHAERSGIALLRTPSGLALAPARDGKALSPEQFAELPPTERERIQREMAAMMHQVPQWEREHRDTRRALDRETTGLAIADLIEEQRTSYHDLPEVLHYFDAVETDVKENAQDFLPRPVPQTLEMATPSTLTPTLEEERFRRYQVKVIIDNGRRKGAPVVYEDNPTHQTLVGRVEGYRKKDRDDPGGTHDRAETSHRQHQQYQHADIGRYGSEHGGRWRG